MDKVREYIDSVGGNAHQSSVRIITALEAENARLRGEVERLRAELYWDDATAALRGESEDGA